jgi:hypothetical protein
MLTQTFQRLKKASQLLNYRASSVAINHLTFLTFLPISTNGQQLLTTVS